MELSITEWCSKTCPVSNPTYHLFGIVMHSGMTSCSGHYQAYVKVATHNDVDLNNNGQTNHHGNSQTGNNTKVDADMESSGEHERQPLSSLPNGTSVGFNTFPTDEQLSGTGEVTSSTDVQSPQSSAEKAKTTCMSGITRYLHRTRKHSTKEPKENVADGMQNGVKRRHHSTPNYSCTGYSSSVSKIQKFRYPGRASNTSAIRQLNFQDGQSENFSCVEGMSRTCAHTPENQTFQWIHFDDAEVAVLEESDVAAMLSSSESSFTSPYLLFYKLAES